MVAACSPTRKYKRLSAATKDKYCRSEWRTLPVLQPRQDAVRCVCGPSRAVLAPLRGSCCPQKLRSVRAATAGLCLFEARADF